MSSLLATNYLNLAEMSNLTIVLGYTAILVIMTSFISLRTKDPDFMLAGRNMPGWLIAASIIGTTISSIGFLVVPERGYALDFNHAIAGIVARCIGPIIAAIFFVAFLRKTRDASVYTLLEDRFGRWASMYATVTFILYSTLRMGIITCLVAKAIHTISGADIGGIMILCGAIVIFYTYMSGIEGVIWTDMVQTSILFITAILAFFYITQLLPSGMSDIASVFPSFQEFKTTHLKFSLIDSNAWLILLFFIVEMVLFCSSNQGISQRYLAARSTRSAKQSLVIAACVMPITILLFFLIGFALKALYTLNPDYTVTESVVAAGDIFIHFISNEMPNGLKGLMIIGILAAAMSTIDTGINSSSTSFICNLYNPIIKENQDQVIASMQVLRLSSVVFGILGLLAAYFIYVSGKHVLDIYWTGIAVINGGIFGLFILMRISKRVGPKAAIGALILGTCMFSWIALTGGKEGLAWAAPFNTILSLPLGLAFMVAVGLALSCAFKHDADSPSADKNESEEIKDKIATQRKRSRQSTIEESLRPKPFWRIYCGLIGLFYLLFLFEPSMGILDPIDKGFLAVTLGIIAVLLIIPQLVTHKESRLYRGLILVGLGAVLPLLGAIAMFAHPENFRYSYFYLVSIALLGLMVGWAPLGFLTMTFTCIATQVAAICYPIVGIPDNWIFVATAALGILVYYVVLASNKTVEQERMLEKFNTIADKVYEKTSTALMDNAIQKGTYDMKSMERIVKNMTYLRDTFKALKGSTGLTGELACQELWIRKCLEDTLNDFPTGTHRQAIRIEADGDFPIWGDHDTLVNCLFHLIDNAFYYVKKGKASEVICRIDSQKRRFSVEDNGPGIKASDMPHIFEIAFSSGKDSTGLGLAYCKKALLAIKATVALTSKPGDPKTVFTIQFPDYTDPTVYEDAWPKGQ